MSPEAITDDTGEGWRDDASPRLTRELLMRGGLAEIIARAVPGQRVLTDDERGASLRATLARRPERGEGLWLFAYGSLIWNPTVRVSERRVACVAGWQRALCLSTRAGRGTPDNPGLLFGLVQGGTCTGAVLRVPEDGLEAELDLLWRREMVTASYAPRWLDVQDADGKPLGQAIGFTIDTASPAFAGALDESEVIRRVATARGELGSCAEYLFRTWHGLNAMGIRDPYVDRVATLVQAAQARDAMAMSRAE